MSSSAVSRWSKPIEEAVDRARRFKQRQRGLNAGELMVSPAETVMVGRDHLVHFDQLRGDLAGARLRRWRPQQSVHHRVSAAAVTRSATAVGSSVERSLPGGARPGDEHEHVGQLAERAWVQMVMRDLHGMDTTVDASGGSS